MTIELSMTKIRMEKKNETRNNPDQYPIRMDENSLFIQIK
jgi:hypothetical protein